MVSAALIIHFFDGQPAVDNHPERQPASLLAVVSSISNFSMGVLVSMGVAVSWWRGALRGTTLQRLHLIWEHGSGWRVISALLAGFDSRNVAILATVASIARFTGNPLFQRAATRLASSDFKNDMQIKINVPQQLPDGWMYYRSGNVEDANFTLYGGPFESSFFRGWYFNTTMVNESVNNITGKLNDDQTGYFCPANSTCTGTLPAAGIGRSCSNSSYHLNMLDSRSDGATVFQLSFDYNANTSQPLLKVSVIYLDDVNASCTATIIEETCNIWTATVSYPFTLINNVLTLNVNGTDLAPVISNYTTPGDGKIAPSDKVIGAGGLLSIGEIIGNFTTTTANYTYPAGVYIDNSMSNLFYYTDYTVNSSCWDRFIRPTDYAIGALSNLMFRAALSASDTFRQVVNGTKTTPTTVYRPEYRFLAAGLIVTFSGLTASLLLFWGFWELDRNVTLSPAELAGAFGASAVGGAKGDVDEMLDKVGDVKVRCVDGIILRVGKGGEHGDERGAK
jgi:hypothetical protein